MKRRHPHLTERRRQERAENIETLKDAAAIAFLIVVFFAALILIFSTTDPRH